MFTFLLVVHALIAATLVGVILMQRSEGGGLGMGGSPTGLMSARGAADFLTRATTILASLFVILSITLAVVATQKAAPSIIDTSLARKPIAAPPAPGSIDPLAPPVGAGNTAEPAAAAAPVPDKPKPSIERRAVTASATSKPLPAKPAPAAPDPAKLGTSPAPAPIVTPSPTPVPAVPAGNSN